MYKSLLSHSLPEEIKKIVLPKIELPATKDSKFSIPFEITHIKSQEILYVKQKIVSETFRLFVATDYIDGFEGSYSIPIKISWPDEISKDILWKVEQHNLVTAIVTKVRFSAENIEYSIVLNAATSITVDSITINGVRIEKFEAKKIGGCGKRVSFLLRGSARSNQFDQIAPSFIRVMDKLGNFMEAHFLLVL